MSRLHRAVITVAALSLLAAAGAQAADWELWPDPATPPLEEAAWLTFLPGVTPGYTTATETDSSMFMIDVHQTREKDGKLYKAIQFYRDIVVEDTLEVGQWAHGGPDNFLSGHMDVLAFMQAWRLVALEIDGTRVPIEMETLLHVVDVDMSDVYPDQGIWPSAWYNVAVRFNTAGKHTYKAIFRQVEDHFVDVWPYFEDNSIDPSPEFEGRRVMVGEQIGDPVDGDIVYTCSITVPPPPTAVEACSWAQVKAAAQE